MKSFYGIAFDAIQTWHLGRKIRISLTSFTEVQIANSELFFALCNPDRCAQVDLARFAMAFLAHIQCHFVAWLYSRYY